MYNPPRFDPDMPLAELIDQHFVPCQKRYNREAGKQGRIRSLHTFVKRLTSFLQREPVAADLAPEALERFDQWRQKFFPHWSDTRANVPALLAFIQSPPVLPVDDENTLYNICQTRYFPRAMKVRNKKTKAAYLRSIRDFGAAIGHEPRAADLTEDSLIVMAVWMQDQKKRGGFPRFSPTSINERVGRVRALAAWMFKKRLIDEVPDFVPVHEPRKNPRAWRKEDLPPLFESCRQEAGEIMPGILAADWWWSINMAIYDCGERIGAMLQAEWDMLDVVNLTLVLPAGIRKGCIEDKVHSLDAATVAAIERLRPAGSVLIWPWVKNLSTLYNHFRRILIRADLPHDRGSKFHRMRRTTATFLHKAGLDASMTLGHDPRVCRESYLDRTQLVESRPCDSLPRPAVLPPLLEYHPQPEPDLSPEFAFM